MIDTYDDHNQLIEQDLAVVINNPDKHTPNLKILGFLYENQPFFFYEIKEMSDPSRTRNRVNKHIPRHSHQETFSINQSFLRSDSARKVGSSEV